MLKDIRVLKTFSVIGRLCGSNFIKVFQSNDRNFSTPFPSDAGKQELSSKEKLKQHQQQVMARGLPKKKPIEGVKNIILVVSGKGGVGKSTTAVNTAVALADMKIDVGLLDADVFGPSIPLMMDLNESPLLTDDNKMIPPTNYGVKCMSMGFLVTEKSAVIWRGLMVMSALDRLLRQVQWGPLDYLVVDTPPGTGDTLLSLIQNLPISGVIMVTTPQKAAVQVARRGGSMLQKLSVPIIGIVENMSYIRCPNCSHEVSLFGDNTKDLATELDVPLISSIPLDSKISVSSDAGVPVVLSKRDNNQAEKYKIIAKEVIKFTQNTQVI
ncbi:iron-sulfur cluster transfer protein NUBPL [Halyomorpha halys]|uniref:iron-sulfur cluster transfer protein NUBPL n=1 Tax=Halyomorpha halys TaxID=286706 RepID=UPI0006D504FC|nr:iron-sulfur protein NUBPL [Halyomorpha halys]